VALAGVESAVRGDACDLLIWRDLIEKLGQHGRVADLAGGELSRPDFQGFLVDPDVDLAPYTAFGAAMLAPSSGKQSPPDCLLTLLSPLAFAFNLDACAVDQQV